MVLAFMEYSLGKVLIYNKYDPLHVKAYSSVGFGENKGHRKSTTSYYTNDNLVTRCSWKQSVVLYSSVEVVYQAMFGTTPDLPWLHSKLDNLGITPKKSMSLYDDHWIAIFNVDNLTFHEQTKHIKRYRHVL